MTLTPSNPKQKTKQIKVAPFTAPAKNHQQSNSANVRKKIPRPQILPMILFQSDTKKIKSRVFSLQLLVNICCCVTPQCHYQCLRPSFLMSPCWLCLAAWDVVQHQHWQALPWVLHSCVFGGTELIRLSAIRAHCKIPIQIHLHGGKVRLKIRTSLNSSGNALESKKKRA